MKNEQGIEINDVKSIFCELKNDCHLSSKNDFINIVEWFNGEGFDVEINSKSNVERFALTWGQFKLLKKMANEI